MKNPTTDTETFALERQIESLVESLHEIESRSDWRILMRSRNLRSQISRLRQRLERLR